MTDVNPGAGGPLPPTTAERVHVPELEPLAYNPMPKGGWSDLRLFRYVGTDLYQWFGKQKGSVFEDAGCDPFAMLAAVIDAEPAAPDGGERERVAELIREGSKGRCEIFAYHKAYAVTERGALEIADTILAAIRPAEGLGRLRAEDQGSSAAPIPTGSSSGGADQRLIADIDAEMAGRKRGYADVRGELLFRCRDALTLAVSEQAVAGEWQPIDTAPMDEEGTHVLIAQDGDVVEARFILEHGWWSRGNDPSDHWGEEWFPTHWMPLPAAPCITAADESSVGTDGGVAAGSEPKGQRPSETVEWRTETPGWTNPQGKGAEG